MSEELVGALQDGEEHLLFNGYTDTGDALNKAPELAEVRTMWTDAHNRKDVRGLQAAGVEAQKVMRQVERGQRYATAATSASEPATAKDSGAFDMDTGPAAGGRGRSGRRRLGTIG